MSRFNVAHGKAVPVVLVTDSGGLLDSDFPVPVGLFTSTGGVVTAAAPLPTGL